jgi:hypothetical protein
MTKKTKAIIYITCLILLVLIPIGGMACFIMCADVYSDSYERGLQIQYNYLKSTKGEERIVFVGSSSLLFGINAEDIEKEFNKKVVIFGSYGAVGNTVMLDWAEPYITSKDTVIFMYDIYRGSMPIYFTPDIAIKASINSPSMFKDLNEKNKANYIAGLTEYLQDVCARLYNHSSINYENTVYSIKSFDEKGRLNYFREANIMEGKTNKETTYIGPSIIKEELTSYIKDWANKLRQKGAKILFAYGPYNDVSKNLLTTTSSIKAFEEKWEEQIDIEAINSLVDTKLSYRLFYNEDFHLNSYGADFFTQIIIKDIYESSLYNIFTYSIKISDNVPGSMKKDMENYVASRF